MGFESDGTTQGNVLDRSLEMAANGYGCRLFASMGTPCARDWPNKRALDIL
jgi:hypothetical protein